MNDPKPPTICNCGLAKSYHPRLADHEYVPRYEPNAWHDGYQRALHDMAEAASPAALDVTAFARIWYEESSGGRWSALSDTVRSLWLRRAERVAARLAGQEGGE